jgi:hypothetical protein
VWNFETKLVAVLLAAAAVAFALAFVSDLLWPVRQ